MTLSWKDDTGSAVVEFVFVSVLLTALTLAVLQLGLALHVRNTIQDAASEGARWASLVGSSPQEGLIRTKELITTAVGEKYARDVTYATTSWQGAPAVEISVSAPLPLLGLWGLDASMEVSGHAVQEVLG
ncbi:Flp pilus assembly protein TadG [Aurantimicrobium minutum]|uniref:TadE family protein n=1 Tax=Aurantimicrobium minutum TaxID=708131 RepID=UPI0024749D3B|nr:pilus assembly protein [Aurantimicrobium minutum]MDH6533316.1 Flp pilus assembly protein TadG [Aurantimicrobium minutum]